jgi:GNAT superfamily N-acetyltransferase
MTPGPEEILSALDATWPAARTWREGPWRISDGQGGGKRVSAARAVGEVGPPDIRRAEIAMQDLGQLPLFMLHGESDAIDAALAERGYRVVDPTLALHLPVAALTTRPLPRLTALEVWEPLAIMEEIWAQGGIGPARLEVMRRAAMKTAIFARSQDKPAGTAFAALHERIAMVHAVEVLPQHRRLGVAANIMHAAGFWAAREGAEHMVVLCTRANTGARALYSALGFQPCYGYHYRIKDGGEGAHA